MGNTLASSVNRLAWLKHEWLPNGPPVCVISGFSGVGKTTLARDLADSCQVPSVYVPVDGNDFTLDDLLFSIASDLENVGLPTMATDVHHDLLASLGKTLGQDQLIVIDDFDYLLDLRSGLPPIRFVRFIEKLATGAQIRLRILLIVDRTLPESIWEMQQVTTLTITAPIEDEAELFLSQLLEREGLEQELSHGERSDIVRWLGRNLGAIESLVVCLRDDSIEDLVELDPEGWELRDQLAASPKLVKNLERKFLGRSLSRLDADAKMLAELLSVYRRPFTKEAIERAQNDVIDLETAKADLQSRYLLERRKNFYSLNPVVRQLCLESVKNSKRRTLRAHNLAADHYTRHFRIITNSDQLAQHGSQFVEAKYHLVRAERNTEFENLAGNFRRQLLRVYGNTNKIHYDESARLQLLSLLSGALSKEDKGYSRLRGLLAKLLLDRGGEGDDRLALRQLEIASSESRDPEIWRLRVRLTTKFNGARIAESVARQGFEVLAESNHAYLYDVVAQAYQEQRELHEGLRFLDEGLTKLPLEPRIYLSSSLGRLLCRAERWREAISRLVALYREGAPSIGFYWRPIEQAMFIAQDNRDVGALREIRQTLVECNEKEAYRTLCDVLVHEQRGQYLLAAERGMKDYVQLPALAAQVAFCWLCSSRVDKAQAIISSASLPNNRASAWIRACVYYCTGRVELALETLEEIEGRNLDTIREEEIPGLLLSVWDHIPSNTNRYPSFYFPTLPVSFTGLDLDLHKASYYSAVGGIDLSAVRLPRGILTPAEPKSTEPQGNHTYNIFGGSVSTYNIGNVGQAGAIGDNAASNNSKFDQNLVQQGTNAKELVAELRRVRDEMVSMSSSDEQSAAASEVEAAAGAFEAGSPEEAKSRLVKAGQWALSVATKIGASLVVEAIKAACGMPAG